MAAVMTPAVETPRQKKARLRSEVEITRQSVVTAAEALALSSLRGQPEAARKRREDDLSVAVKALVRTGREFAKAPRR